MLLPLYVSQAIWIGSDDLNNNIIVEFLQKGNTPQLFPPDSNCCQLKIQGFNSVLNKGFQILKAALLQNSDRTLIRRERTCAKYLSFKLRCDFFNEQPKCCRRNALTPVCFFKDTIADHRIWFFGLNTVTPDIANMDAIYINRASKTGCSGQLCLMKICQRFLYCFRLLRKVLAYLRIPCHVEICNNRFFRTLSKFDIHVLPLSWSALYSFVCIIPRRNTYCKLANRIFFRYTICKTTEEKETWANSPC